VLRHIAQHGDLIEDGRWLSQEDVWFEHTGQWMLVPVAQFMLDALAAYEAERADMEETGGREPEIEEQDTGDEEPDADSEPDADDERNGDDEPNTGDDEPELYDGGQNGGYPMPPDPRALGPIPVYSSTEEGSPRVRREFPPGPTHPVLGTYRRIY